MAGFGRRWKDGLFSHGGTPGIKDFPGRAFVSDAFAGQQRGVQEAWQMMALG